MGAHARISAWVSGPPSPIRRVPAAQHQMESASRRLKPLEGWPLAAGLLCQFMAIRPTHWILSIMWPSRTPAPSPSMLLNATWVAEGK